MFLNINLFAQNIYQLEDQPEGQIFHTDTIATSLRIQTTHWFYLIIMKSSLNGY